MELKDIDKQIPSSAILLRKGYIPKELPPAFTTTMLADQVANMKQHSLPQYMKNRTLASRCCIHSYPKTVRHRRHLGLPNPLHQTILCNVLAGSWTEINKRLFQDDRISLTTPVCRKDSDRAISTRVPLRDIPLERAFRAVGSRIYVHVDFSRYYATMYTHAIPWAIHGKETAKANKKVELLGNLIDKAVRDTMHGQTMGIPVGPDTSLVISELIGAAIDKELHNRLPELNAMRYIDDFEMFFSSYSEAEKALYILEKIAHDYELELNPGKTVVAPHIEPIRPMWVVDLRTHLFSVQDSSDTQMEDIINYFSKAFQYAQRNPDENVLRYVISRLGEFIINEDNWVVFETMILQSMMMDPSVIAFATPFLYGYQSLGYPIDCKRFAKVINEVAVHNAKLNNGHEVLSALWLAKSLGTPVSSEVAEHITAVDDVFVALMALDMRESGLIKEELDTHFWQQWLCSEELYGSHWLFAYEAVLKEWINCDPGFVKDDQYFGHLYKRGISFYDTTKMPSLPRIHERALTLRNEEADASWWEDIIQEDEVTSPY